MSRGTSAAFLAGFALVAGSCAATAADPPIIASHMSASAGPIEWAWSPDSTPDPVFSPAFRAGNYCYGHSDPPPPSSREVEFVGGTLTVHVGRHVRPSVSFAEAGGVSTDLGNPFGEEAWLCSVASDGESVLAVGSDVWWSSDGISWNIVDAFRDVGGNYFDDSSVDDSALLWAAMGPLGYVVLGHSRNDGWYSADLKMWYQIPPHPIPDRISRGWFGPGNVTISHEAIVIGSDDWTGAQIGTPRG